MSEEGACHEPVTIGMITLGPHPDRLHPSPGMRALGFSAPFGMPRIRPQPVAPVLT